MSELDVRGGVGGLEVEHDELRRSSERLHDEAAALLGLAASRHRLLVDGDLVASALLHPTGFARVEAALLSALDGGSGVVAAATALEVRAGQLLVAVARYRAADALSEELVEVRRWLLGATAPVTLPLVMGAGFGWAAGVSATGGDPLLELQRALLEHPGAVDEVAGAVGGLTAPLRAGVLGPLPALADTAFRSHTGVPLLPRDLEESAALLALLYAPGEPVLTSRPDAAPAARAVPAGIGDVVRRLHHRNQQASVAGGTQGDIGLTRIRTTQADGSERVSWLVDIPGTKDWQLDPTRRPALNDLASNLELMAGTDNARVQALEDILRTADVPAGDPVMLVGHSQGGMVAMRAAQELGTRFAITHVVTAGSPVGRMSAPDGVQVLSLENRHDLVPHLDGRDNPDSAGHVTVLFEHPGATVGENHGTATAYLRAAQQADASKEVSVREWRRSAAAFLDGPGEVTSATTTVYTVRNAEPGAGR